MGGIVSFTMVPTVFESVVCHISKGSGTPAEMIISAPYWDLGSRN